MRKITALECWASRSRASYTRWRKTAPKIGAFKRLELKDYRDVSGRFDCIVAAEEDIKTAMTQPCGRSWPDVKERLHVAKEAESALVLPGFFMSRALRFAWLSR